MVDGFKFTVQVVRIVLSYIVAVIFCTVILTSGFPAGFGANEPASVFAVSIFITMAVTGAVGAGMFIPAGLAIVIAEVYSFRSVFFHLAWAGLAASLAWIYPSVISGVEISEAGQQIRPVVITALGFVGGFIYWIGAGRSSGCWHVPKHSSDTSE